MSKTDSLYNVLPASQRKAARALAAEIRKVARVTSPNQKTWDVIQKYRISLEDAHRGIPGNVDFKTAGWHMGPKGSMIAAWWAQMGVAYGYYTLRLPATVHLALAEFSLYEWAALLSVVIIDTRGAAVTSDIVDWLIDHGAAICAGTDLVPTYLSDDYQPRFRPAWKK